MAVAQDVGVQVKTGLNAFWNIVSIGIDWTVDQYIGLSTLGLTRSLLAWIIVILIFGFAAYYWIADFVRGLIAFAVGIFLIGFVGWAVGAVLTAILPATF